MKIRPALIEDAAAISALLLGEAHHITLDPAGAGAEEILDSMREPAIARNLSSAEFNYWVGESGGALQGVVAIRDNKHLYQLFVASEQHGRGIGRALWTHALNHIRATQIADQITVRASPYGLIAYERLGFVATGQRIEMKGISFIPMVFSLQQASTGAST